METKNGFKYKKGNLKLGKDILVFNMGSSTNCPARNRGLCQAEDQCYAFKAERQFPTVLPFREAQAKIWKDKPVRWFINEIQGVIDRARKNKIKYVRFNESGDFESTRDILKLKGIAQAFETQGIVFYGYTARKDLLSLIMTDTPRNLVINGSGFMVHNNFEMVKETGPGDLVCPGDCRDCHLCKNKSGLTIKVVLH